jgi:hypothetical protein
MIRTALLMVLAAGGVAGCYNFDAHLAADGCTKDSQCDEHQFCDRPTGTCKCQDDRGCGENEFCNSQEFCQVRTGCLSNEDCPAADNDGVLLERICDVKTNQCIPATSCGIDADCTHNNVCSSVLMSCVAGCADNGDCILGWTCVQNECRRDFCITAADCEIGETCIVETGQCIRDQRGPFCQPCQNQRTEPPECSEHANYCLIDSSSQAGYFCGVDCFRGQECPSGYNCSNVIILTQSTCGGSRCEVGFCRGMDAGTPCNEDADCDYALPQGTCTKEGQVCRAGEGDVRGHCTCVDDSDCPRDECRDANIVEFCDNGTCSVSEAACSNTADCPQNNLGHCLISGHRCYDNQDCDIISCVNGGCLIGANCAPEEGLSCRDMPQ